MAKRYFDTEDRKIYLTVDDELIEIKYRYPDGSKPKRLWKIYIPTKTKDSPWNCVDYLAYHSDGSRAYNEQYKNYLPSCDLQMLKSELERRLGINLPQKAFEKFAALSMAKALIGEQSC